MSRNLPKIILTVLLLPTITCSWAAALLGEEGTAGPNAADGTVYTSADQIIPWPLPMPNREQIREARACEIDGLLAERYPESVSAEDFPDHYPVSNACDWAVLAAAYALRTENNRTLLADGRIAWINAVLQNAAYAFTNELFIGYFEAPGAVAAPPFALERLVRIAMDYAWKGYGDEVAYSIEIENAHLSPDAAGTVDDKPFSSGLSVETAQALGRSLTDLLPVEKEFPIVVCYDNYPNWSLSLTYENGETVELRTNGSNFYGLGGPWWATIDGQLYLQSANAVIQSLRNIVDELDLPFGKPEAMYCYGLKESLLYILY
ncbi:MAG: hypothetical protein ACK2UB_14235 [Anaerolineales bacterium]